MVRKKEEIIRVKGAKREGPMKKHHSKHIIPALILLFSIFANPAAALTSEAAGADMCQALFEDWKTAYEEGRFDESVFLIKELLKNDPAYRQKAQDYIREKKKRLSFKRTEMDPLLKRKIREEQHLKRMSILKEAFDISYRESFVFDTNPFKKYRNVKHDYLIVSEPHIGMKLGDPENGVDILNIDYTLYYYNYMKHKDQNRFDHNLKFDFSVPRLIELFGKEVSLKVSDYFHPGTYSSSNESTMYTYQFYNEIKTDVAFPITRKTSFSIGYEHDLQWYTRRTLKAFNYQKNIITPDFHYKITPKMSLFGGYTLGVVSYDGGTYESNYNTLRGGITGQLSEKSTVKLNTGFEFRNYHDSPEGEDTIRYVLNLAYTNRLSKKTKAAIFARRSIEESTYEPNPYFIMNILGASLDHSITPKFSLGSQASIMYNTYPRKIIVDSSSDKLKKRRDLKYSVENRCLYKVNKWLEAAFAYSLEHRFSNVESKNYIDHIFTTSLTGRY